MSKKYIHLFTMQFPYGNQETFLENELNFYNNSKYNIELTVHPLFGAKSCRTIPVKYKHPIVKNKLYLSQSFFSLLFYRIILMGLKDLKSKKHFIKLIKQALIVPFVARVTDCIPKDELCYFYWGTNSSNVLLAKSLKHIVRFHRYDLYDLDEAGGSAQVLRSKFTERLSNASFISKHGENYFKQKYLDFKGLTSVSRLGVFDNGVATPSHNEILNIVSCSNLLPVKRIRLLLEAMNLIEIPVRWIHIGSGKELEKYKQALVNLPNNIEAKFLGQLTNSDVLAFYQKNPVDLFINVSESEGLPVSIMEAISYSVPVIATAVGGIPEILPENYLLPADLSPSQVAKKILWFYENHFRDHNERAKFREIWAQNLNAAKNYDEFLNQLLSL